MQQAVIAYQSGNWPEAERLCRLMLASNAGIFDALHLLGIITAQTNRAHEAVELLSRAVSVNPNSAEVHNNRGNVLRDLERYDEALQSFEQALKLDRRSADAHNSRGTALQHLRRFEEALASFDRALKLKPDYAEAHSNRGAALQELNRREDALNSYDRALKINPAYAPAFYNRGNLLRDLKRNEEALQSYDHALRVRPAYPEACNNRGNALRDLRRYEEALASYDRALQLNPQFAEAFNNRGIALQRLRRHEEALDSYDRALQVRPNYAEAHNNRGSVLRDLKRHAEALRSYESALAANPEYAEAYGNRGVALRDLGRYEEALADFDRALKLNPRCEFLYGDWLNAKLLVCDWRGLNDDIASLADKVLRGDKVSEPFTVLACSGALPVQKKAAETCVRATYPPSHALPLLARRPRPEKIRIGYFSADFRDHPVAILTAGLFEEHDRARFEAHAFSFGPDSKDPIRSRLEQAFDSFIDVRNRTDKEVAALARQLEIDIAVDLGGFTQDCRTGIFAMRAAPVQVNFLGFPATMGAEYIDYMLADRTIVPEECRQYYSEKIAYLPSYQPNDSKRQVSDRLFTREEFGLPESGFVFCSFNKNYKILPATFECWMRILKRVDRSVLWLSDANDAAKDKLRKEAAWMGIAAERLVFARRVPSAEDHLARHRLADLFVDTLPYNAHTTASDALWAGLPVLTLVGEAFAGRVAASLLNSIGLPELVAASREEYEAMAVELATNAEKLRQIRRKLEKNRLTTPLFDTKRYARTLEMAYTKMIERYLADLPPDHIYATL